MALKSTGLLAAMLLAAAGPVFASGVQITPGAPAAGANSGSFNLQTGDFVGGLLVQDSVHQLYTAPVSATGARGAGGASASGSLDIINTPAPGILSSATLIGGATGSASAGISADSAYSFRILGAPATAQVRIDALGSIGFSALSFNPGSSGAVSELFRVQAQNSAPPIVDEFFQLSNFQGVLVDGDHPNQISPTATLGFNIGGNFTLFTNMLYDVTLHTRLNGTVSGAAPETLFANIDPMFTVDGPFTIEVSPGFGGVSVQEQASGAPEPAAWAMLLLGFCGVGTALRRRRAVPA